MKLRLLYERQEQAAFLRYVKPSVHVSRQLGAEAEPLADTMDLHLSFAQVQAQFPEAPVLHICKQFAVLFLPKDFPPDLLKSIGTVPLYAFKTDKPALQKMAGQALQTISWLHEFYAEKAWAKILVCGREEMVNTILGSAPDAFIHFYYTPGGFQMSLGAELRQYRGSSLRAALASSERICLSLPDKHFLPFMVVQGSLAQNPGSSYSFFADRYDRYMAHVDYDKWFSLLLGWQNAYGGTKCKRVLELACGTAAVASRFVHANCEVFACDLSPQMLENAEKRELKPILYQASLTDPIPHKDLDLIICMFDSINYLQHVNEIKQCLREVSLALAPKGLFIFDISTLLNSMENFSEVCSISRDRETLMAHEAYYEPGKRRQVSQLELFIECGAGFVHQSETHTQRVYMVKELVELIQGSDLKLKAVHSTENKNNMYPKKMQGIDHRYYRLFFVLSKK
jgi:SAM-dependent methyltransferase